MAEAALITRQQMADAMVAHYNAEVTEHRGHDWRRVSTVVAEQGDMSVSGAALDFHMFEFCHSGRHDITIESALETGDRQRSQLLPGGASYFQAKVPVRTSATGTVRLQQIYIDDCIFRETATSLVKGDPDKVTYLGFSGVFEPGLRAHAAAILEEARAPLLGSELQADLLAQQMALIILRRRLGDGLRKPLRRELSRAELARVIDYLEADLAETGGMDTLAALIDMDVFTFTRAFKQSTGQPPHKFLIERRLARVKDLLINTDSSLADIAYDTGFSSQPHMTAAFSKHAKMPPGAYRKRYRR